MYHLFFIWALALFLTKPRSLLVGKVAGTKSEKKKASVAMAKAHKLNALFYDTARDNLFFRPSLINFL